MASKVADKKRQSALKALWWYALIVTVAAVGVYANTIGHGYVLDDADAITENVMVRQGTAGVPELWQSAMREGTRGTVGNIYRPVPMTLFALEWEIWPNDPAPAHGINVLLFALACVLLFYWLSLVFGTESRSTALFVTLFFAVHPIHTEVVANIKSADELLMFIFGFLALIALWKNEGRLFSAWIPLALGAYFLSLASKESAVTLIGIALIVPWFFRRDTFRNHVISAAWLVLPIALYLGLRASVLGALVGQEVVSELDNLLVAAQGSERFFTAMALSGLYLWKLFVPHPLMHDYSLDQVSLMGASSLYPWLALVAFTLLIFIAIRGFRKKSLLSFAIIFFLITLSLYTNFVLLIGTHFAERLLFLPSVGFCIAAGWFFARWQQQITRDTVSAVLTVPKVVMLALLVALGVRSILRNAQWESPLTLYEADVENAPNSARTHYRLGLTYNKQGLGARPESKAQWFQKAIPELSQSVDIYPSFTDAHNELGLAYKELGQPEKAMEHFNTAIDLNPLHFTALNNKGSVLFARGETGREKAIQCFEKALEANPNFERAASNLGAAYGMMGDYKESIRWFKRAVEIDPGNAQNYFFIGLSYQNMGEAELSKTWAEKAYALDPSLRSK